MQFGKQIKNNLTRNDFAKLSRISKPYVSMLEKLNTIDEKEILLLTYIEYYFGVFD